MFFKFDGFANRLTNASPLEAMNPAGLVAARGEVIREPEFYFESKKVKPVKLEVDVRHVHGTPGQAASAISQPLGVIPAAQGYSRVVDLQKSWLSSENLMVWQKRGVRDVGMYYATLGGCALGVGYCFYLIYKMSFPKKPE